MGRRDAVVPRILGRPIYSPVRIFFCLFTIQHHALRSGSSRTVLLAVETGGFESSRRNPRHSTFRTFSDLSSPVGLLYDRRPVPFFHVCLSLFVLQSRHLFRVPQLRLARSRCSNGILGRHRTSGGL